VDIGREVEEGRFRADLLYRLNTVEVRLPPLRERREDVPLLASHFLAKKSAHYRKGVERFGADAMRRMLDYDWPGNIRELEHAVERAVLLAAGDTVEADDLALQAAGLEPSDGTRPPLEAMELEEAERYLIRKALERCGGNVSQAADALGLSRSALYRRLQRYGL
jgi:DNA-binding NtrC family response regulator